MSFETIITALLGGTNFRNYLQGINNKYFYLKQERHIRDALIEELNASSNLKNHIALSEYPRDQNGQRDIGIFELATPFHNTKIGDPQYSIEIKFHYPLDLFSKCLNKVKFCNDLKKICVDWNKEVAGRATDCLILIICERDWLDSSPVSAAPSRQHIIDLMGKDIPLRINLAKAVDTTKADFDFCMLTTVKGLTLTGPNAITDYTFLVLFRNMNVCSDVKMLL